MLIPWDDTIRVMLNQIPIGIVLLDSGLKVVDFNSYYYEYTGDQLQISEQLPETNPFLEQIQLTFQTDIDCRNVEIRLLKGKEIRSLQVQTVMLRRSSEELEGMMLIVQDVTEFKQLQQEYLMADRLTLTGKLAAGTVHEIRNPLTVIQGFLTMLRADLEAIPEGGSVQQVKKHLNHLDLVFYELQRINRVIGNFLMFNKHAVQPKQVNIAQVLSEIAPLLENEAILQDIAFRYRVSADGMNFLGDNEEFKQVILNLVKNAFEATGPGGIVQVEACIVENYHLITVEDNGCGIPDELIDRVMSPFFTTKENGTGLGLSICQKIISSLGGELSIRSRPGRTMVEIRLPSE